MTNYEIVKQALAHLEYGDDEYALSQNYERFVMYINDAVRIIAQHIKLETVEPVVLRDDHFDTSALGKQNVTKIVEVFSGKRAYPFIKGDTFGDFVVLHGHERINNAYEPLYGDADLSGTVTAADAALALRHTSGLVKLNPKQFINADVDGDGSVTQDDVDLIMNYVNSVIDTFPVEATDRTIVNVRFRYLPDNVMKGDAEPDIPAVFHPILYLFVVHAHHNTRSASSDYDRTKWLQEFEKQRRVLSRAYGAYDEYVFKNKPWQTGEM